MQGRAEPGIRGRALEPLEVLVGIRAEVELELRDPLLHDALVLMRFMSDFREAMWGVVQQVVSELDFDFADYAKRHFERLEQTAAEPRFRAALH